MDSWEGERRGREEEARPGRGGVAGGAAVEEARRSGGRPPRRREPSLPGGIRRALLCSRRGGDPPLLPPGTFAASVYRVVAPWEKPSPHGISRGPPHLPLLHTVWAAADSLSPPAQSARPLPPTTLRRYRSRRRLPPRLSAVCRRPGLPFLLLPHSLLQAGRAQLLSPREMGKRKPTPSAGARGPKNRPKRPRSAKQGAEENPQLSEHDDGIVDTESGAVETVQRDKKANGSFEGIAQSDEDDIKDEYDAPSGDAPGDTINNGNGRYDETETSCSFHCHVSHIVTNEEVEALIKKNCKFKWEIPAVDIPRSKWVGTGEKVQEACDAHLHDVKGKLGDHWQRTLSGHLNARLSFFSLCNSYRDIMHCNKKPFYLKSNGPDSSTMDTYLMHALNHVHRTRDVVIRNDTKLRNDADGDISDDKTYLDQGFTRPKVLFLLPLKSFARRIVKRLIQLSPLPQKDSAMGQFKKEFGESDDEGIPEHSTKPADFDLLFAGDIDDHFLFGVKLTKKSIKLYSNFYSSDIIVASPLALKRKIDGEHGKEKDFDFLSSIEIVVVDHADVISMQNWEHLEAVFEQLNQLPSKEHGTNVMRIRPWYLDQNAKYYRQTILLSSYLTPEINALFNGLCLNYEGKIKMVTEHAGVLPKIQLEVRQVYERFDASSISEADDARFDYFCNKVYPKIQDLDEGGLLLFVSSYFEYIRISNFLKSKEASFCRIGEATSQQDISRARLWFFEGKKKILLYSERSHFYHRYKIRGTKHLLIYSLPGRKEFYPELVNMLGESEIRKCNVLFSRLDLLKLERIVGTSSARRLISSDKGMFVFC